MNGGFGDILKSTISSQHGVGPLKSTGLSSDRLTTDLKTEGCTSVKLHKHGKERGDSITNRVSNYYYFLKPDDRKRKAVGMFLVREEAGKGLSEGADGLGFGLVVGQASS